MTYDDEEMYALLTYLVSSAARLGQEPASYGPMRLIEAAKRLSIIMAASNDDKAEELNDLINIIEEGRQSGMSDEAAFQEMLDAAVEKLVDII